MAAQQIKQQVSATDMVQTSAPKCTCPLKHGWKRSALAVALARSIALSTASMVLLWGGSASLTMAAVAADAKADAIEAAVATRARADSLLVGQEEKLPLLAQVKAQELSSSEAHRPSVTVTVENESTREPVDLEEKAKLDPLAHEEPSLLQRLFSGSFNSANASDADMVASYQDTFFVPTLMEKVEDVKDQSSEGEADLVAAVPFKLSDEMLIKTDAREEVMLEQIHHGMSFVSYLLHMYSPQRTAYEVPVFFVDASALEHVSRAYNISHTTTLVGAGQAITDEALGTLTGTGAQGSDASGADAQPADEKQRQRRREEHSKQVNLQLNNLSLAVDGIYGEAEQAELGLATLVQDQGANTTATVVGPKECQGMTLIEADLKGKCRTPQKKYNGVILLSLPIAEVMSEGIFSDIPMQVTPNVLQANYFAQGVDLGMRLVGVNSSYEPRSGRFTAPLHSFDKHLYSPTLQKYVSADLGLSDIASGCGQQKQDGSCQLYFVGANLNNLLQTGNEQSAFNLRQKASLDVGTPYAAINTNAHAIKTQGAEQEEDGTSATPETQPETEAAADASEATVASTSAGGTDVVATTEQALDAAVAEGERSDLSQGISSFMDAVGGVTAGSAKDQTQSFARKDGAAAAEGEAEASADASASAATAGAGAAKAKEEVSLADVVTSEANTAAQLVSNAKKERAAKKVRAGQSVEVRSGKQDLYGVPVTFSALGKPLLGLRNTLLSADQYKNYTFLTEAEMAVLSDLGYYMEPREFFGRSLYSFGTPERRIVRTVQTDFALYDHASEEYQKRKPSLTPLAVGVHLYGSYNDVVHSGNVLTAGSGAIGVRVDGSENFYYQTSKSSIITSGESNVGLGFTYGRDNRAYISGHISALGRQGIGIKVDMGSNIYSDLVEYRGSYVRVRTLDYLHGFASQMEAARVPLLDELNGPQVSELIIDGEVEGSDAAIYIDESSFVKSINITSNARVSGGIYSIWNPRSTGSGDIIVTHDGKRVLIDGVVQYPRDPNDGMTSNEFINQYLTTAINLGVTLDERNRVLYTDDSKRLPLGNDKARVVLDGDLSSNTFKLRHIAGKSTILGNVRASSVDIFSGILSLCSPQDFATNQIGALRVHNDAVLDFVNGKSSNTYVQRGVTLGSNVTIRVDVDTKGEILDEISWNGDFNVRNYQLTVEPGMPYNEIRRLSADPKAMLNFITSFVQQANQKFAKDGVTVRIPHYIWDSAGNYGRELRCNARGCRIGAFTSNSVLKGSITQAERWRYIMSFVGLFALIAATYAYFHLPRFLKKRTTR